MIFIFLCIMYIFAACLEFIICQLFPFTLIFTFVLVSVFILHNMSNHITALDFSMFCLVFLQLQAILVC